MLYEVITLLVTEFEGGGLLQLQHVLIEQLTIYHRITSYNVCYTKLLRKLAVGLQLGLETIVLLENHLPAQGRLAPGMVHRQLAYRQPGAGKVATELQIHQPGVKTALVITSLAQAQFVELDGKGSYNFV